MMNATHTPSTPPERTEDADARREGATLPVLTYEQFRKLYKATRNFQHYTSQDRADIASSHRQGHVQRQAVGEFFYTHDLCPGVAFDTAQQATQRAYDAYLASVAGRADLLAILKDILPIIDDTAAGVPYRGTVFAGIAKDMRAAIAKAEGGRQ